MNVLFEIRSRNNRKDGAFLGYSELIKNFERIRGYLQEFYIYGFKTREAYDKKVVVPMTMNEDASKVI